MIETFVVASTLFFGPPSNLTGAHTGFPGLANASGLQLRLLSHSVTVKLYKDGVRSESLTLIKNDSDKGGKLTLNLPQRMLRAEAPGAFKRVAFTGTWDNLAVTFTHAPLQVTNAGDELVNQSGWTRVTVEVKPRATHALRLAWTGDLMAAGLDLKMRAVAYDTSPANSWPGGVPAFNYAIQFQFYEREEVVGGTSVKINESPVFAVTGTDPEDGWQIGSKGAFRVGKPFTVPPSPVYVFAYYPNGFGSIGR